ncbi:MAG: aldo/keto reductase [Devosia sp.]|uniref:aldo/keto reductase n=1 Tax=Devosia sp. TaxID=1871048 RepID=UPI00262713AF|nr:aldo/keto reductase [Devosia sp.]MDB5526929.1 aldo/keto reductase [Devosia sp.]
MPFGSSTVSRLALGTVQFGLPYGIANRTGQVTSAAASQILASGNVAGIDTLDTAIGYGESESVLGGIGVADWRIISKLPPIPTDCADIQQWLDAAVAGSLSRLGVPRLTGLLLHAPADLLGPHGSALVRGLGRVKAAGQSEKLGVSIYDPTELDGILTVFQPDIVQCPYNVFDRRLLTSGWLTRLHGAGTEIHVRSIFLQGLLLMDDAAALPKFAPWRALLQRWQDWLAEEQVSAVAAALNFAAQRPEISRLVVGVDGPAQLNQIIEAAKLAVPAVPEDLQSHDLKLLNPSNWSAL